MRRLLNGVFFYFLVYTLQAQMPNTDVWLFKLKPSDTGELQATEALNITHREGYDNQPFFSNDSKKIYYVSVREDKQADIYCYDIKSKSTVQITKTKESEYSPVPSYHSNYLNSVVVEADSAQRVHDIPLLPELAAKKIDIDSIGYYCFLNADTMVYYKLTDPHSLRYYVQSGNEDKWLANAPVRGFKAVNRHCLVFGIKDSAKVDFYLYDFLLQKAKKYCSYPSVNEDIWWHNTLGLMKSEDNTILRYVESENKWVQVFDLSSFGIKKITRLAFDQKNMYLLVVNNL